LNASFSPIACLFIYLLFPKKEPLHQFTYHAAGSNYYSGRFKDFL
jgi:hypothetical protein